MNEKSVNYISVKKVNIYIFFTNLNNSIEKNPIKKWKEEKNRHFSKEDT